MMSNAQGHLPHALQPANIGVALSAIIVNSPAPEVLAGL